jgi:predicted nucleic acid-binding protein
MARYLADTSAWVQARRRNVPRPLGDSFARMLVQGEIATCGAVIWELLHSAGNAAEYMTRRQELEHLDLATFGSDDWARALDIAQLLADKGGSLHRAPSLADAVIAVAAERAGLPVLHYDKDFDLIAGVTGQPCEWIAPKGSL